jgi:hypothetical protein
VFLACFGHSQINFAEAKEDVDDDQALAVDCALQLLFAIFHVIS